MTVVKFYDNVEDDLLKFAVIAAEHQGKMVYCKHKDRDTLELPGGHREAGGIAVILDVSGDSAEIVRRG